jgi:CopG family nickel-responsive transcriptional regulator
MTDDVIRFGVSMNRRLLDGLDRLCRRRGYASRSEAIRDMVRERLVEQEWEGEDEVAGTITIVYDHHAVSGPDLLNEVQHRYRHLIVATMHVHLDHDNCLEVLVVKGRPAEAREVADRLVSAKGVKHGRLTTTSTGRDLA